MNSIAKKISYISVFIFTIVLIVSTLASEKAISFPDITDDSPWHDAVVYFAGKGMVSGQKDGMFHPEAEMSSQEWTRILIAMDAESAQFASSTVEVDPAGLYASIWHMAKIETHSASEYGYVSNLDAGTTAMIVTGLIQRDDISRKSVSRGEALRLLYEIGVKKSVTEVPVSLASFFEVIIGEGCSPESETKARSLLASIPTTNYPFSLPTTTSLLSLRT